MDPPPICWFCRILRYKCQPGCQYRKIFPVTDPDSFQKCYNILSVYGMASVNHAMEIIEEEKKHDACQSYAYEAEKRLRDPVMGSAGIIAQQQAILANLTAQLKLTTDERDFLKSNEGATSEPYWCQDGVFAGATHGCHPENDEGAAHGYGSYSATYGNHGNEFAFAGALQSNPDLPDEPYGGRDLACGRERLATKKKKKKKPCKEDFRQDFAAGVDATSSHNPAVDGTFPGGWNPDAGEASNAPDYLWTGNPEGVAAEAGGAVDYSPTFDHPFFQYPSETNNEDENAPSDALYSPSGYANEPYGYSPWWQGGNHGA